MIKINLLPVRAAKKKETTRQQIRVIGYHCRRVLVICIVFIAMIIAKISTQKMKSLKRNRKFSN